MNGVLASPRARSLAAAAVAASVIVGLLAIRNCADTDPLSRLTRSDGGGGRQAYEGSWQFPRHGPYKLGFDSPRGPAELWIDGVRIVAGKGRVMPRREPWTRGRGKRPNARLAYHPGVVAVRFVAPPGARLLWSPAGRRGGPEYVAPSSLSPDPPDRAAFTAPGTYRRDGVIVLCMILVLAGLLGYLCRAALARADRRALLAIAAVFGVALLVRILDLGGAGQTWDEDVNWAAGRNYVQNLLNLDFRQSSWIWNYEHPPVMKYVAGFGALWSDGFGVARGLSAMMVALACALLVPIGARLHSLRVGVLAGLIASLSPHLVAHAKVVGHEAPTLLLWTLAIWLCLRAHDAAQPHREDGYRRRLAWQCALIGAVLGLAIMSRFVNVLLAPLIGSILMLQAPSGRRKDTFVLGLVVIPIAALGVALIVWPRLWSQPLVHLQQSWAKLKGAHGAEPFLGTLTNAPPRYYFFIYFVATAPLGVLVAAGGWLARAGRERDTSSWIVVAWLLAPMIVALSPVRQDGVRYIMPSLMALAMMAAVGIDFVAEAVARRAGTLSATRIATGVGAALAIYLGVTCARIHPYYLDYYGELYGGPRGVAQSRAFETAWWGEGVDRAVDYVNTNAAPGARVFKGCVEPSHLTWLRGDLWPREVRSPAAAEWIIVYAPLTRPCAGLGTATLVYEVRAQGAPLARVYRRGGKGARPR